MSHYLLMHIPSPRLRKKSLHIQPWQQLKTWILHYFFPSQWGGRRSYKIFRLGLCYFSYDLSYAHTPCERCSCMCSHLWLWMHRNKQVLLMSFILSRQKTTAKNCQSLESNHLVLRQHIWKSTVNRERRHNLLQRNNILHFPPASPSAICFMEQLIQAVMAG